MNFAFDCVFDEYNAEVCHNNNAPLKIFNSIFFRAPRVPDFAGFLAFCTSNWHLPIIPKMLFF